MLKVENLVKTYGNSDRPTINNLSFEVKDGEIFGFLGSNGAGKTTTIKCICGVLPFEGGDILINDISLKKNPKEAKLNLAYISDNHAVFERLTGREYVNHIANLYNTPKEKRDEIVNSLLDAFSLSYAYDRPIKSYSHGMKQKINVIAGLVHEPKLWVLDEPLLGLDPQSGIELKKIMKEHAERGNTVFFSSHILEVVESLCDRVGILNKGILADVVDLHELKKEGKTLEEVFVKLTQNQTRDDENKEEILRLNYLKSQNNKKNKGFLSKNYNLDKLRFVDINIKNKDDINYLKEFYNIYENAFPDINERESFSNLLKYLDQSKTTKEKNKYHVLATICKGHVIAGAIFDYLDKVSSGVIEYIFVDKKYQRNKIGNILFARVLEILKEDGNKNEKELEYLFGEIDDPSTRNENDRAYIYFWTHHNFKKLKIKYYQPALEKDKKGVEKLFIIAKPLKNDIKTINKNTYLLFLENYFEFCFNIKNVKASKEYIQNKENLNENIILDNISS